MSRQADPSPPSEAEGVYEDDFEQLIDEDFSVPNDLDDDVEFLKKLGFTKDALPGDMSSASESPCTDSAGEKNGRHHSLDMEMLTSLDSVYTFEDETEDKEDTCSARFNFRLLHEVIDNVPVVTQKKYKNGTRASLSFSNERMKEIDRTNRILLDKIMRHKFGPAGVGRSSSSSSISGSRSASRNASSQQRPLIKSAAEINRRKKQQQINYENAILRQKLEKIASRRRPLSSAER